MTKEQKKATRKALRQYAEGPVRAAWAEVIEGVLRHYEAVEPLCAQLLRLRYLDGKSWGECARRMGYADESGPRKLVGKLWSK